MTTEKITKIVRNNVLIENYLPSVNSHDYWIFRKRVGMTHADYTQSKLVEMFVGGKDPGFDAVVEKITKTFDTIEIAKMDAGTTDKQVLQYLNQLTEKGLNRLINKVRYAVETKA
jgi:hypothetical protein